MKRSKPIVILLVLGFALLPISSAWSLRQTTTLMEQIVPDSDDHDYYFVSGGGASSGGGYRNATNLEPSEVVTASGTARTTKTWAVQFREVLMSIWLQVWTTKLSLGCMR